jgi:molybdenum cofactor cytidylyltransferase
MNISAIIMAAGLSKRMNQNKLQMKINNKYIFEFIFETIKRCSDCFNEIIVVAKDDEILNTARGLGFSTVRNEISYLGQSVSVKLGIQNSKKADGYMFFVADQPFIKECTIRKLLSVFEKNPNSIVMPCYKVTNGSPVIFSEMFKEQLMTLEGDTGGKVVIKNNTNKVIKVQIQSEDERLDIDTMEDYYIVVKKVNE